MKIGELSGSLTNLLDGTSYLIAGTNVAIVSESNGAITISSTGGPAGDQFFFSTASGSIYSSGSLALIGGGDEWGVIDSPTDKGTDVFFYVSGSIGSKDSVDPGVSLFGGDVVISGSFFSEGDIIEMTGSLTVTGGISGSLTNLPDGTSYLVAGNNISIASQSNGSILISNTFAQVDDYFDSSTPGSIFTSGSTAFVGIGEFGVVDSPVDKGTDVFFYVSGSIGSKDSIDPGVSLFGGDVVISGSLFSQGNLLEVTGTLTVTQGISGSLTNLADGTSYLIAGNNIGIISQSNGSIIISSSTPTLVYRPGGSDADNVYSSWSSLMSTFNQLEGIVNIDIDTSISSPATVPVGTYDFESRVILRGTQTGFVNPSRLQMPDGAVIKNPREFENIWLDMLATTSPNFDIDVDDRSIKFSGVSYIEMNGTQPFADITAALTLGVSFQFRDSVIINNYSPSNRCFLSINNASANVTLILIDNVIINNDNLIAGTVGSLYIYHDSSIGTNFLIGLPTNPNFSGTTILLPLDNAKLIAYDDIFAGTTELSASTVQTAIDVLKDRWSSSTPNHLFTTSSIAIKGDELGIDQGLDKGTDVFFYVSGSQGSKDGGTPGVALFGGDVVISGTLYGGSPLKFGSDTQVTGSLSQGSNSQANGAFSHAEGIGALAHAISSHAEGGNSQAGCFGYIASATTPGLIVLDSSYGDVSAEFPAGVYIVLNDYDYDYNYGHQAFKVASAVFNSPSTEVTLLDSSVTTTTAIIGTEQNIIPASANYTIGSGSHAEGSYAATQGPYAHAEGGGRAIGENSHAEGTSTSVGYGSHAEGYGSKSVGIYSHAEGWDTLALGDASHAEGYNTTASGLYAHAEGANTIATGEASHAEGILSVASGSYSHAEGYNTIASGSAQTVIGKYNLRDNDFSLFVVGNGTGDANNLRSDVLRVNELTVGVTGSLQVTGSLYVSGSTNVGVITEGYNHSVGDTGTVVYNIAANSIFYVNNPAGNITANFTNVPTTDYRITTTTVILSQSSTPRTVSAVQIDGVGSTIDWLNGSAPSGTADKQDVFSFNLIRSGSIWKTLGQLSTYG